jgi:hypothetical protein
MTESIGFPKWLRPIPNWISTISLLWIPPYFFSENGSKTGAAGLHFPE